MMNLDLYKHLIRMFSKYHSAIQKKILDKIELFKQMLKNSQLAPGHQFKEYQEIQLLKVYEYIWQLTLDELEFNRKIIDAKVLYLTKAQTTHQVKPLHHTRNSQQTNLFFGIRRLFAQKHCSVHFK